MAQRPNGESTWHHTKNSWVLYRSDGSIWALASVQLDGSRFGLSFPVVNCPGDFYYGLILEASHRGIDWQYHRAGETTSCVWDPATPSALLLPMADMPTLGKFNTPTVDMSIVATMRLEAPGRIAVFDDTGDRRIELALGARDAPAEWASATLHNGGTTLLTIAAAPPFDVQATSAP